MSVELQSPPQVAGLPVVLPPHLTEKFERADRLLRELYGQSPGVAALVRMWVACATAELVCREFEAAVLQIKGRNLNPNKEGDFDEDCL